MHKILAGIPDEQERCEVVGNPPSSPVGGEPRWTRDSAKRVVGWKVDSSPTGKSGRAPAPAPCPAGNSPGAVRSLPRHSCPQASGDPSPVPGEAVVSTRLPGTPEVPNSPTGGLRRRRPKTSTVSGSSLQVCPGSSSSSSPCLPEARIHILRSWPPAEVGSATHPHRSGQDVLLPAPQVWLQPPQFYGWLGYSSFAESVGHPGVSALAVAHACWTARISSGVG
ncbi:DUF6192 family protein [Streptomyces sp. BPTC-684]|uniref:DUF6192 family protein n=1 Tax=Streptomyces sp. BPTC-684 TaxID=3043734 RepID=UPI0024B132BC|nr:DUF6192 family protein [Streptomyces sp. BPTC-684]WHM41539.1 DUF6192 family protein [Streptomyces sp. BPTC-684]